MINIKNQSEPLEIVGKGLLYSENEILYFKNEAGIVSEVANVITSTKENIYKDSDYTILSSECDGTKTFIFNKDSAYNVDWVTCTLPSATTGLSTTIINKCNNTLVLRLQGDDVLYCNGQTYDSLHDFYLNYSNQEIVVYSISSTEYVGLTTNQDYSIKKIYVNPKDQKGYLLTESGNLYFWGLNYSYNFNPSTPSNFNDNGNVAGSDTYIPYPMTNENLLKINVSDFWYVYNTLTSNLFVLDNQGCLYTLGFGTSLYNMGRSYTANDGLKPVINHSFCRIFIKNSTNIIYAEKSDSSVWTWGNSILIGNGTSVATSTPTIINPLGFVYADHTFCSIYNSQNSSFGLKSDGSVWSWGDNGYGQLGDGTTTARCVPVSVCGNHTFCAISAGSIFTLGLKSDGSVWSWGHDGSVGSLGQNTNYGYSLTPQQIFGNHTFCQISAGDGYSLGLKSDGSLWSWGRNDYGQLGDGTTTNQCTPISVCGNHTFVQISNGGNHSISLKSDGSLWSWGYNGYGQLGDGTTISKFEPTSLIGGYNFCSIFRGFDNTFAIKSDGSLWAWGRNDGGGGNLGDGTFTNQCTPISVCGNHTFCQISAGLYYTLGLKSDGSVWAWGYNYYGGFGSGGWFDQYTTPISVTGLSYYSISVGSGYTLGLKSDGSLWSWGYNGFGQLGDGTVAGRCTPGIIAQNILSTYTHTFVKYFYGDSNIFAIKNDGSLWSWGDNFYGNVGDGTTTNRCVPVSVCGNHTFCNIFSNSYNSLGLKPDGSLWSWGYNSSGQLGDNTTVSKNTPVEVCKNEYAPHTFCKIFATSQFNFGLKSDGSLWSWGLNNYGQLGDGTTTSRLTPVQVCGNHTFCQVFLYGIGNSGYTIKAIKSDGSLWSWGADNSFVGILGDGTTVGKCTPVSVVGNHTFCQIYNALSSNFGLKSNGSLFSWGANNYGQLGDNSITNKCIPVSVVGNHTFCQISAGLSGYYALGLKSDGSAWSWGFNGGGNLGDGTATSRLTPVSVCGNHTFLQILSTDNTYSLGLKSDGSLWSWGRNNYGQLGDGTMSYRCTPVRVCGNHTFCQISAGYDYSLGLKSDGSLWAWGYNIDGRLGDGTITNRCVPVSVCGNHTFCQVFCGGVSFTVAIKSDGSVWTWGRNYQGILGNGSSITSELTPVSVCGNHTFCSISVGSDLVMGLKSDGSVWTWGYNNNGSLGNGTINPKSTPTIIVKSNSVCGIHTFCQIYNSTNSFFAKDVYGSLWSWGDNLYGQLGDGTVTYRCTPVAVCGNHVFCNVVVSESIVFGIKSDGSLWSWGNNRYGQLGINNIYNIPINNTPTRVCISESIANIYTSDFINTNGYITNIIKTSKNRYYSWTANHNNILNLKNSTYPSKCWKLMTIPNNCCINDLQFQNTSNGFDGYLLKTDGSLYSWGVGAGVGIGGIIVNSPYQSVSHLPYTQMPTHTFCQVSATCSHVLGLKQNGTVWAWGYNNFGQLGDGTTISRHTPVSVLLGTNTVCQISTGVNFSTAIRSNGVTYTWGSNQYGQLGDGTFTNRCNPTGVFGGSIYCAIYAGSCWVNAQKADGSMWGWGVDAKIGFGGNSYCKSTPVSVFGNHTFCQIYIGGMYDSISGGIMALRNDNTLWSWGGINYYTDGAYNQSTLTPAQICTIQSALHIPMTRNLTGYVFLYSDGLTAQKRYNWTGRNSAITGINGGEKLGMLGYCNTSTTTPSSFVNETLQSARKLYYFDFNTGSGYSSYLPSAYIIDYSNRLWKWGFGYNSLYQRISFFPDETPFNSTPVEMVKFFNVK